MSFYNDETGKPEDIVPESVALRRGMSYDLDRHGKVCRAEDEAPLLIDRLYNHEVISDEHHFYGVQLITMRKLFLSPVGFKVGMLRVASGDDDNPGKPIPMQDTDYLRVLRGVKDPASERLVREICDEAADPGRYQVYGRQGHAVRQAFDALCGAVREVWERKKDCVSRGCAECTGACTAAGRRTPAE